MSNAWRIWTCATVLLFLGCRDDDTTVTAEGTTGTTGTSTGAGGDPSSVGDVSTSVGTGDLTTTDGDSTTDTSLCGNGELDPGEECDDGNDVWLDACRPDCTLAFEELWTHSYDGPGNLFDTFRDVVVDAEGTIYVTGSHVVEGSRRELLVKAYAPDGREGWTFSYRGAGDGHDFGESLAWLPGGDLVVCGSTTTTDHGDDFLVMRLSPGTDDPIWVREYSGPSEDGLDVCVGVAVDDDGNIVGVGSERTDAADYDIVVRKYDADGTLSWSQTHAEPFGANDLGLDVAIDAEGNIMALGRVREAQSLDRTWVRSYDPDGNERWTYRSGSDGSANWFANGIAIDADGEILLTGTGASNVITTKLDADAQQVWRHEASSGTAGRGVAVDASGNVVVAGSVNTAQAASDVWAGGFDGAGQPRWGFTYGNAEAGLDDWANSIVVDHDGDVVVVGVETVFGQQTNGWIRKIRPAD